MVPEFSTKSRDEFDIYADPRIDAAGRVTVAINEKEAEDCGTLEEYKNEYAVAKASLKKRIPEFFETKQVVARYVDMFENITKITDANWYRDFDYEWTASDEFIETTRKHAKKVYEYVKTLEQKSEVTDSDFEQIFKQ